MARGASRFRLLLLATLYVAGNFGLPAGDLLLNHSPGEPHHQLRSHFEGRAGCHDHADHCVLNRLLSALRLQTPVPVATTLPASGKGPSLPLGSIRVALAAHPFTYRSRAPPLPV